MEGGPIKQLYGHPLEKVWKGFWMMVQKGNELVGDFTEFEIKENTGNKIRRRVAFDDLKIEETWERDPETNTITVKEEENSQIGGGSHIVFQNLNNGQTEVTIEYNTVFKDTGTTFPDRESVEQSMLLVEAMIAKYL